MPAPISGRPTGNPRSPPSELNTPANDAYQATNGCHDADPATDLDRVLAASQKYPMNSTISVSCNVRNTAKTAALTRVAAQQHVEVEDGEGEQRPSPGR